MSNKSFCTKCALETNNKHRGGGAVPGPLEWSASPSWTDPVLVPSLQTPSIPTPCANESTFASQSRSASFSAPTFIHSKFYRSTHLAGKTLGDFTFFSVSRPDAWISPFVQNLYFENTQSGFRQKHSEELFSRRLQLAMDKPGVTAYRFVKYWKPKECSVLHQQLPLEQRWSDLLTRDGGAIIVVHSPFASKIHQAGTITFWVHHISLHLGSVHDCIIAKIDWNFRSDIPISSALHI